MEAKRFEGERRETDRRKFEYAIVFPERRNGYDRRLVPDRRNLYLKAKDNL